MSHPIKVASLGQVAMFRAYEEAGAAKTDLTATTAGLVLSVFRVGASPVSIASLSDKAADDSAHAAGAIRHVAGNLYSVDIPDASVAVQVPSIAVVGSYTGGVIEGDQHPVVGYDATAPRVGASDFDAAADLVDIGSVGGIAVGGVDDFHADVADPAQIAAAVRLNLALELGRIDESVSAAKTLTAGTLSAMIAGLVAHSEWIELLADAEASRAAAVANGEAIAGLPSPLTQQQVRDAVESPGGMVDTIRSKLAGITSLGSWLRALMRSDVPDAVAKSEINIGGGNYDEALHSLEAAEDARDANFQLIDDGGLSQQEVRDAMQLAPSNGVAANGSVDSKIDGLLATGLAGPNAINIRVLDDSDDAPIESARVRVYRTGESQTQLTAANGETGAYSIASATWSVAVDAVGYENNHATLVVAGDVNYEIRLVATAGASGSDAPQSTLQIICTDEAGTAEEGVSIMCRMIQAPANTGFAFDGTVRTSRSDATGLVEFVCVRGATYEAKRGSDKTWRRVQIDDAPTTQTQSFVGHP